MARPTPKKSATLDSEVRTWTRQGDGLPLFIAPETPSLTVPGALPGWLQRNRAALDALLLHHGGIVLRGFSVADSAAFDALASVFEPFAGDYAGGGSPRARIVGQVHEATQLAPHIKLTLHQEMSYAERPPARIAFFCARPAEQGGETTVADMRRVTAALPGTLRDKLEQLGVSYVRNFAPPPDDGVERAEDHPDQRSWQFAFYTKDRAQVEAACRAKNFSAEWRSDGGLIVRSSMAAFARIPRTGEAVYRSALHIDSGGYLRLDALPPPRRRAIEAMMAAQDHPTGCYFGDGTAPSHEERAALEAAFAGQERAWAWEAGDVMLLDNLLVAHGRNPFEGSRDVQVVLLD